jgi:hypothetical protein
MAAARSAISQEMYSRLRISLQPDWLDHTEVIADIVDKPSLAQN